jgi:hypothetical protein
MSTNIGHIEVLNCDAKMLAKDVRRLAKDRDLPECCFLEDLATKEPDADGYIAIDADSLEWGGEFSGSSWKTVFLKKVAPTIRGTLEAIVTWEDGEFHTGLRIRDGKVTEPEVKMTLAEDK